MLVSQCRQWQLLLPPQQDALRGSGEHGQKLVRESRQEEVERVLEEGERTLQP